MQDYRIAYNISEELRQAMAALASDKVLRDEMGKRGARAVKMKWSEARHLERYLESVNRFTC